MAVGDDHSRNLPRKFAVCGCCGLKGAYQIGPVRTRDDAAIGVRCKYCKTEKWLDRGYWMGLEQEAKLLV